MGGAAGEEIERMRKQMKDGRERGDGASRASGKIQDKSGTQSSADGTAEGSERRLSETGGAHQFGQALDEAVADQSRGFRRDVARSKARAAGGDHKVGRPGVAAQGRNNLLELIGDNLGGRLMRSRRSKLLSNSRPGKILAGARKGAVANGEYGGSCAGTEKWSHLRSLRC